MVVVRQSAVVMIENGVRVVMMFQSGVHPILGVKLYPAARL